MTPGARESDALLVAMYERKHIAVTDPATVRWMLWLGRHPGNGNYVKDKATDLGFRALVTGDYGEAD